MNFEHTVKARLPSSPTSILAGLLQEAYR